MVRTISIGLTILTLLSIAPAQESTEPAKEITRLLLSQDEADHSRGLVLAAGADEAVLRAVLDALRERALAPASPETSALRCNATLLRLDRARLRALELEPESAEPGQAQTCFLSAEQARKLSAVGDAAAPSPVVTSSQMLLETGETATIKATEQVAYVSDFDVEVTDAAVIADPIIDTLQDGVVCDITCAQRDESGVARIEIELTVAELRRPIEKLTTSVGNGAEVTIQLPEITIRQTSTIVSMTSDGSSLLIVTDAGDSERPTGLLLTVGSK